MIQPAYKTLQELFADRVFRIPHYQRFYSWHKKQREDLFHDLRKLSKREDDNHHFMATVVCHKTSEVKAVGTKEFRLYDVVDGQQRLTTLIILLKCIQLALKKDSDERDELGKMIVKKDGNLVLLQTNNANEHLFNSFLRHGKIPRPDEVETHADRNLRNGIVQCKNFVKEWEDGPQGVFQLLRLINNRLGFVIFDTEDNRVVYSVFEVLNSRGLAVDWLDKCKSVLMERAFEMAASDVAAQSAIGSLQNLWGNIYDRIAEHPIPGEQILRVAGTLMDGPSKGKPIRPEIAIERFRDDCDTSDKPELLARFVFDVATKLVGLQSDVFYGPVTDVLHARILAAAILSAEFLTDKERQQVMMQWERMTFRLYQLEGLDSRHEVGAYIRLATKIHNRQEGGSRFSEIMDAMRAIGSKYPIDTAIERLPEYDCYEYPDFTRYLLWKYEEHLAAKQGKNATVDEQERQAIWAKRAIDSIEHIFPQRPEVGGYWDGRMIDDEGEEWSVEDNVGRIGNLILLPITINAKAGRQPFKSKKTIYKDHNLRMIQDVLHETDWDLSQIQKRERRIMDWAINQWCDL